MEEIRILLIGRKKDGKVIIEITDSNHKSMLRAVGRSRNELLSSLRQQISELTILREPLTVNGFRISQSAGVYIPCEKVSEYLKKDIENIVFPKTES